MKLTLTRSVAKTRFGASINFKMRSSTLVPEVLRSSRSVGEREKNADSAADTNATMIRSTSIVRRENKMLSENGFTIIAISGEGKFIRIVLVRDKIVLFSETYNLTNIML